MCVDSPGVSGHEGEEGPAGHDPYEYIQMSWAGSSPSGKTQKYTVYAKKYGSKLGTIKWFAHWRQYAFMPDPQTVFSAGCMDDINHFIRSLR